MLIEDFIKNITINENQDSVITIGDTLVNATVYELGRRFNQYQSIDIPIGIEYSKPIGSFEVGVSSTALINLNFKTKGTILNENEDYIPINDNYKSSIGLRLRLSAPMKYHIGEKLAIGLSPSYTYSPQSISSQNYPVEHRVNLFSMRLFADYKF